MNNLEKNILNKIKTGEIDMKPKWHFVLRGVLWAASTILVALIAIYFLSFILYALRESGLVFAPLFGWSGIVLFIVSSPWLLVGVVGVFLATLYLLVSHYSFSYKKPLVYSMVGLVLFVIILSSLLQVTNFHGRAGDFVNRHAVPGFTSLYRGVGERSPRDVTYGKVSEISDMTFNLTTVSGDVYLVKLSERTKLPRHTKLHEGDAVFVFGPNTEGGINAFGVRLDDGRLAPPPSLLKRNDERSWR